MIRRLAARSLLAASLFALAACGVSGSKLDGAKLYAANCARCHGDDGRGDPRSVGLYPALDLSRSRMLALEKRFLIRDRILGGYGTMPGFKHRLEPEEVGALVDHCLTFAAPAAPAASAAPREP